MRKNYRVLLILFCLALCSPSFSQVLIDVKTKFEEKKELHHIKIALVRSLDTTGWSRTVEVGENFSFWLKNLKRTPIDDSLQTTVDLEFRTPTMIFDGQLISAKQLSIVFDTSGLSTTASQSDTVLSNLIVQNLHKSNMLTTFLAAINISISSFTGTLLIGYFIKPFVANFFAEISRRPSQFEAVEATLLAAKILPEVELFVKERYPGIIKH